MGIISHIYKKKFVCRYDKEVGVPYYSHLDFKGLHQEAYSFVNSKGIDIHYFYYYYDKYQKDKVVLFCHGIGPGHTAYLAEIEALARRGFKVLTFDATGCGQSGGKYLGSLVNPTGDAIDLLNYLNLKEEVVLVGHSMGGLTTLNVINLRKEITKAVVLSGFLSAGTEISVILKNKFIFSRIMAYERKINPQYIDIDNIDYLKNTTDDIFFIQSSDDAMVPYETALKVVEGIDNPHIKTLRVENRKHNPNYTDEAVKYMNDVFYKYNCLIKDNKIKTDQDKINYFKDVSLPDLVRQDEGMWDEIASFINK